MNTVHLHGQLGRQFGGPYQLEIRDAREAIRALGVQLPGFLETVAEGEWRVVRGQPERGHHLDEESLELGLGDQPLHILPAVAGAGNGGGKAILGVALIAVAWWNPAGWAAGTALMVGAAGAGMAVAGAAMMMAPTPETGDYERKEKDTQSFLFNGPVNVNKQGVGVPLIYGEVITGSVVISAGIRAEDIPVDGDEGGFDDVIVGKIEGK